ncbi:MAG: hypothetical protein ACREJB_01260, partial [Planctomycetaceae bacterium]
INLDRARVEIIAANSPANSGNRREFQEKARQLIAKARGIYQTAHDQHKKAWESYGVYIDPQTDRQEYEARARAETAYIRAQLDLALCTYEEAQTYDEDAPQFKQLLTKAARQFEQIHQKYRSMGGGLYARMWQGKCFEEQGEIGKALGIYDELLRHPGTSETMQRIQDQVRQFRLICLNDESKNDHQLVIQEAQAWLTEHRGADRNSAIGLGIQWELARAEEAMGMRRDVPEAERERHLERSRATARAINRFAGKYKDVSMLMIRRIQVALNGDVGDPQDFATAVGLASNRVKEIKPLQEKLRAAKDAQEKQKLQQDLDLHLAETARILNLGLQLADDKTEIKEVNNARYLLAYLNYLMKRSYEAAILAEFIARHFREENAEIALDSAYIALAAYQQAYNAADKDDRAFDIGQMVRVSNLITEHWPGSDRANDARMTLGTLYGQLKEPARAAEWYSKIPENAPQYSQAQLEAGQAYWSAYLNAAQLPAEERPDAATLAAWQTDAEKHLRTGIERLQATVPKDAAPPEEFVAAKVTLAQILINQGNYEGALGLLTGEPHP